MCDFKNKWMDKTIEALIKYYFINVDFYLWKIKFWLNFDNQIFELNIKNHNFFKLEPDQLNGFKYP